MLNIRHDELLIEIDELRRNAERARYRPLTSAVDVLTDSASTTSGPAAAVAGDAPVVREASSLMTLSAPLSAAGIETSSVFSLKQQADMDGRPVFLKQGK
jgi:hypothetical protein